MPTRGEPQGDEKEETTLLAAATLLARGAILEEG
jgi:hypothetical protein